jgi:hypothetical protein
MRVKPSHCKPVVANVLSALTATNSGAAICKKLQTHVRTQKYEFNMQYGKTGNSEQKFITEKPVPQNFQIFVSNSTML